MYVVFTELEYGFKIRNDIIKLHKKNFIWHTLS